MSNILQSIRTMFAPIKPLPAGIYHYISPADDPRNYRLHLRLENDGSGILILNASSILHLNQSAAEYAYYILQNRPVDEVSRIVASRYHVTTDSARKDYLDLIDRIQILINTPDLDPETFLDFQRKPAHQGYISAPYRLDCAITYRLSDGIDPALAPIDRVKSELSTSQWKVILDKAWDVGIPHIVFTGGEPTLRPDLIELISYAQLKGQVAGLISNGLRLGDRAFITALLQSGLDHLMLTYHPEFEQSWKILTDLLMEDLFIAVHLTITQRNVNQILSEIKRLSDAGVQAVSLSTDDPNLHEKLNDACNLIASHHIELVWNLPVPYSTFNPVSLETSRAGYSGGVGRDWLYVEPDGDVLPGQGVNQVLGNFINSSWEQIWKNRS